MGWAKAVALLALSAGLAQAEEDLSIFRPMPRPEPSGAQIVTQLSGIRPMPRPLDLIVAQVPPVNTGVRPMRRPDLVLLRPALPAPKGQDLTPVAQQPVVQRPAVQKPVVQKPAKPSLKGSVCQRPEIKGKALPPIRSSTKGCNVPDPVLVSQISGVVLNPPATINCEEATALSTWVTKGLQPAFKGSIIALNVVDSYACRPRNNVRGNPVSVHGLGQAIDISGFVTNTGHTYTVAQNYNAQIRAAQKAGCGTFHTILGPGSDGYHENHIHFDVSHHGGRDYCH